MLGAGDHALRRADLRSLKAADLRSRDDRAEEGVLPCALDHASPPRIASDVDHWRERPMDAHGTRLTRRDRLTALDHLGIPGCGQRDRDRQDRPQSMDHIKAKQHRNPEPMTVDREPLQAIDLRRIGHEQQRPRSPLPQHRLDHRRLASHIQAGLRVDLRPGRQPKVEVLGQLPSLLGHGHLGDQLIDPRPHSLFIDHVKRSYRGLPGIVADRAHHRTPANSQIARHRRNDLTLRRAARLARGYRHCRLRTARRRSLTSLAPPPPADCVGDQTQPGPGRLLARRRLAPRPREAAVGRRGDRADLRRPDDESARWRLAPSARSGAHRIG